MGHRRYQASAAPAPFRRPATKVRRWSRSEHSGFDQRIGNCL